MPRDATVEASRWRQERGWCDPEHACQGIEIRYLKPAPLWGRFAAEPFTNPRLTVAERGRQAFLFHPTHSHQGFNVLPHDLLGIHLWLVRSASWTKWLSRRKRSVSISPITSFTVPQKITEYRLTDILNRYRITAHMARRVKRNYPDLRTYFEESGDTMTRFAARYRRSIGWVSQVTAGKIEPAIRVALRISRETGVPLESLACRPDVHSEVA